jgi:hypothetical protein
VTLWLIAGLGVGCIYLLKQVSDSRAETAELRGQIASLKRQLAKRRS